MRIEPFKHRFRFAFYFPGYRWRKLQLCNLIRSESFLGPEPSLRWTRAKPLFLGFTSNHENANFSRIIAFATTASINLTLEMKNRRSPNFINMLKQMTLPAVNIFWFYKWRKGFILPEYIHLYFISKHKFMLFFFCLIRLFLML